MLPILLLQALSFSFPWLPPLGLCPFLLAPAFASWVSAEIAAMARARGVDIIIPYIDDFLVAAATEEECRAGLELVLELLAELGVEVAPEKVEGPCQE